MHGDMGYDGAAIDISMRGCTVRTQEPLSIARIVTVGMKIPDEKKISDR